MRWIHILCLLLWSGASFAQEICNNAIDDDGDGLIDLNDTEDCPCFTVVREPDLQSYIRNHSFEERMCCPFGFVAPPFTPPWLSCADGWQQATGATSDYFNECGYAPAGFNLPPPDGDGAVGFFAGPGYFEYVGTCLTYPAPSNPLLAGTTYTLSLWISCGGGNGQFSQSAYQADPSIFTDQLPLAIFGHANECVEFPINGVSDCIGFEPGWVEMGRVMVQPAWNWTRVSITFTPSQEMHTIMIGGACDTPTSYGQNFNVVDPSGNATSVSPYFLVDDLMLTIAQEQVLSPTTTHGNLCAGDAAVSAQPPPAAVNYQWYRNGVAIVGQTGTTLSAAQLGLGSGMYTMSSVYNGECLMGSSYIPPPIAPTPWPSIEPSEGCAPLTVAFADTTGGGTTTMQWDLGGGILSGDSAFTHTYSLPGSYDVRLTVRNPAGCEGDTLLEDIITVHSPVSGAVTATPNPTDVEHPEVALSGAGSIGDIVTWWWDLGVASPSTATDPAFTATFPSVPGSYPVLLVVTTASGCVDTVRSVVVVRSDVIEMPNVFSPNGDGHNDRFVPLEYSGAPALLEIYNRWGQMVFSTRTLEQGWSGADVPDGTYYYVVTPDDAEAEKLTGHITLVR